MIKIIFLDVDGVLNGYNFLNLAGWNISCFLHIQNWYKKYARKPFAIHEEKVKRLAKIVHSTYAKVVMSSIWRYGFWNVPYENKSDNQKLLTDLLKKYDIEVIDITPKSFDGRRDKEILSWLSQHENEIDSFVVLDDERFDLECFVGTHLVQTSSVPKGKMIMGFWYENTGLKNNHVKKAIEILNKGGKYGANK